MFLFTSRPMAPKTPLLKRKYLLRKHRKMSGTPALPSSHVYKGMRGSGAGVGGWWFIVVLVVWSGVRILRSSSDLDHEGTLRKPVSICESAGGLSLSSVSVSAYCC